MIKLSVIEIHTFLERYVENNMMEQISKLKKRFGKNNIKRVIPGVRETCDDCETSLFNAHFICIYCGGWYKIKEKCAKLNFKPIYINCTKQIEKYHDISNQLNKNLRNNLSYLRGKGVSSTGWSFS